MATIADPTNVMGRRVGAALLDGLLVLVLVVVGLSADLEYLSEDAIVAAGYEDADEYCDVYMDTLEDEICFPWVDGQAMFGAPSGLTFLGWFAPTVGMFVLLQGLAGWTPGKLLTGIRTVREDGSRVGIGRAFVRWVLWIVDGLPAFGLVGFITALTSTGHRRVGDMVAKTLVVRSSAAGRPVLVPGVTGPPAITPVAPGAQPSTGPQWDEARGTYVQWDPEASAWMRWDEPGQRWDPIAGPDASPPAPPPAPPTAPPPPPPA